MPSASVALAGAVWLVGGSAFAYDPAASFFAAAWPKPWLPMLLDFDVRSCSRQCAKTGDALKPGDIYFSVLQAEGRDFLRLDYGAAAWEGPPEESVGWWRSRVPTGDENKPKLAPTDVMLNLFSALADRPEEEAFRYLLGLLLLRRRVLRCEETSVDRAGCETLTLFCPRRNEASELVVAEPNEETAVKLQQRMIDLLYGDGTDE